MIRHVFILKPHPQPQPQPQPRPGAKLEVIDLLGFLQQLVVRLELEDTEAEKLVQQVARSTPGHGTQGCSP